ncbi:MAG TPA: chemotaxis protein CheB [Steroidobacteraceae bacterium]|nr:chemotaxis protein CheB [Steroidobacteraceae bacterium]
MASVPKRKSPAAAADRPDAATRPDRSPGRVVGIGASAGGLEALRKFFGAMPAQTGLVFVVVVHLDPAHRSFMPELLGHATGLTVEQARDGQPLEVDHVYVIPPNCILTVDRGLIRVQEVADRHGLHGSIDRFFSSLAEAEGERAVAIVLSGTGTEGTLGARAIRAAGGLVMAQTPETAAQSGMPGHAIAAGVVDEVLAPEKMPQALLAYARKARASVQAADAGEAKPLAGLPGILELLRDRSANDFRIYRKEPLERRIAQRMALRHVGSVDRYLELLRADAAEADRLITELLTVPTGFFRYPPAWEELATEVVPALLRSRAAAAPIRAWVPGCSTGEEAYSLAIVLAEQTALAQSGHEAQIFATDMDESLLAVARAGSYPASIARDVTPERLARFFVWEDNRYTIRKAIRASIVFAVQNPATDPPFSRLDLIVCRNALLHFEPQMQDKLLTLFHFVLNPGGYLYFAGPEGLRPRAELFEPLSRRRRAFRRIEPVKRPALELSGALSLPVAAADVQPLPRTAHEPAVAATADRRLLEHFAATAVLVRPSGEILRFYGALTPYLQLPGGLPTLDVLKLARDVLRPSLREALDEAVRRNRQVVLEAFDVTSERGSEVLRITVRPVDSPGASERLWLIVFEKVPAAAGRARARGPKAERGSRLIRRIRSELRTTRKEHQRLIAQLESGNEELRIAHEEVITINEALQTTNEELTSSKEELQSMNEELTTLNTQLEASVAELTAVNDDLANLLVSTDNTTVIVDTGLRIKRFTAAASRVLNLLPGDSGRPLTHIATELIDVDLPAETRAVLATLQPIEKEVATRNGRHYFLRVLPYRTSQQRVQGVVLTLVDVSTLRQAERELHAARALVAEDLRRMTRLHELGGRLAASSELPASLEELLRAALEITAAQMGAVQQYDPAVGLRMAAHLGLGQPLLDYFAQAAPHADAASAQARSSRQRVLVEDVTTSPLFADSPSRQVLLAGGVRAVQCTPLLDRSGQLLGMFSTHYRTPHRFGEEELRWLDLLARHAGDAFERWRAEDLLRRSRDDLEHQVADRTRWLRLLHEISQSINDAPTWDSALQRVLEHICAMEEWQIGYVYLPDPEAPDVITPAIGCMGEERLRPFHEVSERQRYARGERLPGRVYARGVARYATDRDELLRTIPIRSAAARQVGLQAGIAHPITAGQEVIAVLELFSDRALDRRDWFDNLLPAVTDHIGRILERERTMGRMADLVWREQQDLLHTLHDSLGQTLTGLGMLAMGLRQRLTAAHGDIPEMAAEVAKQAQQALEQVRQLSRSLFPLEVEAASLTSALRELAFATQSLHKIQVQVEGQVPEAFTDGGAATQLYRIAQEAVTNAVKHAQARSITIHVGRHGSMLRLRIADDGIGIGKAAPGKGIGLQIMRYRAHSIGGILIVEPGAHGGTVVTCTLRTVPASKTAATPARQDSTTRTGSSRD